MADGAIEGLRNLNNELKQADANLATLNKNFATLFNTAVKNAANNAKVSIDDLFSYISTKVGATKANQLRLMFNLVDEKGNPLSESTIRGRIKTITDAVDKESKKIKVGGIDIVGKANMQQAINDYKQLLKIIQQPGGNLWEKALGITNTGLGIGKKSGTAWSNARANEMERVEKLTKSANRELEKQKQIEQAIVAIQQRGGRGAKFEGQYRSLKQLTEMLDQSKQKYDKYVRELGGYGERGRRAQANFVTGVADKESLDTVKQLIAEYRQLEKERRRLEKVAQDDAKWQEQQRRNKQAIYEVNAKVIAQQEKLTAQIADYQRKYRELAVRDPQNGLYIPTEKKGLEKQYLQRIEELKEQREMLERRVQGSKAAGINAYENSTLKAERDAAEAEKKKRLAEREGLRNSAEMKRAIATQMQYQRQLNALRQQYNELNRKTNRTDAENAQLEKTKQKIIEIINLAQKLDKERPGSHAAAVHAAEVDRVKQKYRELNKTMASSGQEMDKLKYAAQRLASAFGIAFSLQSVVQFGKKLVETRGQFEMQFVSLKQIIGDLDKATKIWNQTLSLALKSPFTAMQLTTYTKQLAAYRIETDKLYDTTKRLADVSAGLGVDMGRLILAYGQVKTANFLRASEVRQFTEAGVNIYGELAKYFTEIQGRAVSTAEVVDMVQKRMVSFADVEAIFKRMTDEGGQFFDMQRIQSDTVRGQIMKLKDAYDQMLNTIGAQNQGAIRDMIAVLLSLVRNWRDLAFVIKGSLIGIGAYIVAMKSLNVEWKKASWQAIFFNKQIKIGSFAVKEYWQVTKLLTAELKFFPRLFQRAAAGAKIFGAALKSLRGVWAIAAIEAIVFLAEKLTEASRRANQLRKDLEQIRTEQAGRAFEEENGYIKLVSKYEQANQGSKERSDIISELNSKYGKYLDFVVDETTAVSKLAEAYNNVQQGTREAARARAEEAVAERLATEDIDRETKARQKASGAIGFQSGNWFADNLTFGARDQKENWNRTSGYVGKLNMTDSELDAAFNYLESKVKVEWAQLKDLSSDERRDFISETFATYFGVESDQIRNAGKALDMLDIFIDKYSQLADSNEEMRKTLAGSGLQEDQVNQILEVESKYADIISKVYKGGAGEALGFGKIVLPEEMKNRDAVLEFIKERLNLEKEGLILDLKVSFGAMSREEANKMREKAKSTGDEFADTLNKEIEKNVLGDNSTLDDLWDKIDKGEQLTEKEADDLALINSLRIRESDIVNGIDQYEKQLTGSLETQRKVVDDLNRKREAGLITEEKFQDTLGQTMQKYEGILHILSLLKKEIDPKDTEILMVGAERLEKIKENFKKKFGYDYTQQSTAGGKLLRNEGAAENLREAADTYHKYAEELENQKNNVLKATDISEAARKETLEEINRAIEEQKFLAAQHGYTDKIKKGGGGGQKEGVQRMIDLIKRMNDEYKKLKENAYGAAKSEQVVRSEFEESVKQILGKAGVNTDYDFTTKKGMVEAMTKVRDYVRANSKKMTKEALDIAQKQLDTWEAEIKVAFEVQKREEFERKMEALFKDYELTVELKGLNIPQDVAQKMFGFEYQSLWDLQKEMDNFYAEQKKNEQGDLLDEKAWDSYKKYAEKIEDEIYKERKERAKKYSEFLKEELSARATLTKEYYENLAMVAAESSFTDKERENIITGLTDAYKKALQKLDWEDFKSSDFYVEMMEDLTEMPVKYMEIMLKEVNNIIEKADVLSPRALKEALRARREVQEAILSEASFKGIFEQTIGAFRAYRKSSERGEGDEFNKRAEELYGKGKTIATSGRVRERKLLRESINLRAEELANIEKTIDAYKDQNGRLKAYYDALEKLNQLRASGANFEGFGVSKAGLDMLDSLINDNKNILAYKDSETSPLLSTLSGEEKDKKVKELEQEITRWQGIRKAIDKALIAQQAYNKAKENLAAEDYLGGIKGEGEVVSLSENVSSRNKLKVRRDTLTKAQMGDKDALKDLKRFEKAWQEFSNTVNDTKDKVKSLGSATYDMLEALGAETNVVTEAWKNFGDTLMDTIIGALTMIPQLVVGFVSAGTAINAAMGIIGLIAEAIQLVIVLVTSLDQLHDAQIKKDLEDSKKRVDALSKAYDRLKESIDATITAAEYFVNYSETIANINDQIQEANFRLQEAQGLKKKADREEAIAEAEDALEDLRKKRREAEADLQDTFGGIARDDFRSWAEDFVSAWTDAFKETGDGYDALMETFEEKMMDTFKKQALMRGLAKIMEPVENAINSYVGDDGVLDEAELADIRERMRVAADNGDAYMRQMAELFDLSAEGSLSGLTAGIQGMTEEQADVLTGYWNSVRLYAAEIDLHIGMIADAFNNPESTNPMLNQIRLIARNTESINSLLDSVSKGGHTLGGTGIKVFVQ